MRILMAKLPTPPRFVESPQPRTPQSGSPPEPALRTQPNPIPGPGQTHHRAAHTNLTSTLTGEQLNIVPGLTAPDTMTPLRPTQLELHRPHLPRTNVIPHHLNPRSTKPIANITTRFPPAPPTAERTITSNINRTNPPTASVMAAGHDSSVDFPSRRQVISQADSLHTYSTGVPPREPPLRAPPTSQRPDSRHAAPRPNHSLSVLSIRATAEPRPIRPHHSARIPAEARQTRSAPFQPLTRRSGHQPTR
jgi:hypothetical protein